jgi:hypothetical protein
MFLIVFLTLVYYLYFSMKQKTSPTLPHLSQKFLKPGTLAQIRDSRIRARSHHRNSRSQISIDRLTSMSLSGSSSPQPQATIIDDFPVFANQNYGPRCLQRKKLIAAKSVFFVSISNSPDLVNDTFGDGFIVDN